jgi:hypothetical protein
MHRSLLVGVSAAMVATLAACAAADTGDPATSSDDWLTSESGLGTAHQPIPFVLQYVGVYHGDGHGEFSSLDLRRDGTFIATVGGERKTGRYEGGSRPDKPVKLAFILRGDSFTGEITGDWNTVQHLNIGHGAPTETLTSSWLAGAESVCDDSGGTWWDDDPDPKNGLYCSCPAPEVYIPSAGGCTR